MKLIFFLIAFFLVLLRVYFSWAGHRGRGNDEGNMTMTSDNYIKQVKWSGKIKLSDDEKTIAGISPGGYLKFRENDRKLSAESNLQGDIHYELYDGHSKLNLNDSGRRFISAVLQEMIAFGFNAAGRPERVYKKGGNKALLNELPTLILDNTKGPYLDLLFKSDSLSKEDLSSMLKQIDGLGDGVEKENYLKRFTADQLRDTGIALPWLAIVDHIGPEDQKNNLFSYFLERGFESEVIFDKQLQVISHFSGDMEKGNLYTKLINENNKTENQWIDLINEITQITSDFEKSNLLVQIAQKMPKNENTKAVYAKVAKTITNDMDYGKAMRAVE